MGGKRAKKKQLQVRSIVTRSAAAAAARRAPAAPAENSQEGDVSVQGSAAEESVGDENSSEKQVQVRTIAACSSSPAAASSDPLKDDVSHQGGAAEDSARDDRLSRVSMKGGCGKVCRHVERGVTVERLATHLSKSKATLTQCQICIKEDKDASSKKNKARSARKKSAHNSAVPNGSHEVKKWVCLACGHVACGRISTTAENQVENVEEEWEPTSGHAWKHSILAKHPVALQAGDKLVSWCFTCNAAVDCYSSLSASSEVNSETEESRGPLQQAIKIVCDKLVKEGVFFKNPGRVALVPEPVKAVIDATPHPNPTDTSIPRPLLNGHFSGSQRKRVVRGLMNLGNTCFFNSVIQNLLALDLLRNYFSQDSQVAEAPLTSSLRRLYLETNVEGPASKASVHGDVSGFDSGLKKGGKGRAAWETSAGAYNPRSLFGAICTKAPRFRGFQQQDSHELLRCLLEGLSSEEQSTRVPEAESRKVTSSAKSTAIKQTDRVGNVESVEEQIESGEAEIPTPASQMLTFVDNFFGGQLSSTVRCCECGHSSVVYEPILDLSLQIPSRQISKKGRAQVESSLVGRPENVPLSINVRSSGTVKKVDMPEAPPACSLVVTESKQVSSEISSSGSASEIGNTSKLNPQYSNSLDDFGWLDFLGGGTQSADGSLQGPHLAISSMQNNKNAMLGNSECFAQGNLPTNAPESLTDEKSSSLHLIDSLKSGNKEGSDEWDGTAHVVPSLPLESSGTHIHLNGVVDAPTSGQALEDEKLAGLPGEDDEPLPLASGILLLPYEPLQVPTDLLAEERLHGTDAARSAVDEFPSSLQGEEKDTASSSQVEEDGGDFVGVSQLFEEDESFTVEDHSGLVKGDIDGSQITEDISLDSGWDAGTGEESDVVASGSQKLVSCQDGIIPMSVEGCLAEFTKSELLSGDNAWECENCSRRIKETAPLLASSNEGNMAIGCKGIEYNGGGEKQGKSESERHSKDVPNPAGEGVSSSSDYVNGNFSHVAYGNHSAVSCKPNGIHPLPISLEDDPHSEASSGSWSHANGNGNINDKTSTFKAGNMVIGKLEENDRCGNGSARLNNLDSGQISGKQSPLCQRDDEETTYLGQGNCTETLQEIPPKESGCVKQNIGGEGEKAQFTDKDLGDTQSVQRRKPSSAQVSGKRHVLIDFGGPEELIFGTSSRDNKLHGPFRIPGKPLRPQKSKNRKSYLEDKKVLKMDATKRLLISKAPPILTIHLKRFAQDMCGRLNKLSGHVAFPEVLDLRPFLDSKCFDSDDCIYRLVGVVEHSGTMRGGHYIAYVRGPASDVVNQESQSMDHDNISSWYYISDSSVHKSSLQTVLNSEAYLLFYEKCEAM